MNKINSSFSSLILLNLIKKDIAHFLFAILAYVQNALWKRQLISLSSEALYRKPWKHNMPEFSNPKLVQERWFLFFVYFTGLCTGRSIKKHLIAYFEEKFKKNHEKIKGITFQPHVSNIDQKKYSKFSYCFAGLSAGCSTKKENQENTTWVYFAVVI